MWQKELKQLKKQITKPIECTKKQKIEKYDNESINFSEYCNSLNIIKFNQDKVINSQVKQSKYISYEANSHDNQCTYGLDFIDINEVPDELFYNGQKNLPQDLRNGKYIINKTIDIHGLNKEQAWKKIEAVIDGSTSGAVIKIIHGQGINSEFNHAVLQNLTRKQLYNNQKVLAYTYGSPTQGGKGITILKLRN